MHKLLVMLCSYQDPWTLHSATIFKGLMWNIALDGNGNPKLPGTNSCGGPGCRALVTVNSDGSYSLNQECKTLSSVILPVVTRLSSLLDGTGFQSYHSQGCGGAIWTTYRCFCWWIYCLGSTCGRIRYKSSIVQRSAKILYRCFEL